MFSTLHYLLYITAILSLGLSIHYSIKSKKTKEPYTKGLLIARMNISMGVMLICFAFVQLFLYGFESWVRVGVGFVFLLVGLFNLFAGIRNHSHYNR